MPSFPYARQHHGGRFYFAINFSSSPKTLDCLQPDATFLPQQPAAESRTGWHSPDQLCELPQRGGDLSGVFSLAVTCVYSHNSHGTAFNSAIRYLIVVVRQAVRKSRIAICVVGEYS